MFAFLFEARDYFRLRKATSIPLTSTALTVLFKQQCCAKIQCAHIKSETLNKACAQMSTLVHKHSYKGSSRLVLLSDPLMAFLVCSDREDLSVLPVNEYGHGASRVLNSSTFSSSKQATDGMAPKRLDKDPNTHATTDINTD